MVTLCFYLKLNYFMKHLVFYFFLSLISLSTFSQVIFYEDFDGIVGSQAGGAGTYSFPEGWLLRNVDNSIPNTAVSYVNEAWERREDFANNVNDSAAFSTSWSTPEGAVDDWMWTPAITLSSNCVLSWNGVAYDPSYLDGYEVRIMVSPDVPMGGPAVIGNQVTNSTLIFSIASEANTWTNHSVDLTAYAGQTVRIAFRNNSNNMFVLLIDDVQVEQVVNYEASIQSVTALSEYTHIPIAQVTSLPMQATVLNEGLMGFSGVALQIEVFNTLDEEVYSALSEYLPLPASSTLSLSVPDFLPEYDDTFQVLYSILTIEEDFDQTNNLLTASIVVSDTVYARDDGNIISSLGIGAGNGGYLGQSFEITMADTLTSVSMYFTNVYAGEPYAAVVWDMLGDVPNQIVAASDTLVFGDNTASLYTVPMSEFEFLQPGKYVITAVEFDSTLSVATVNGIYTPGTTWINWPTIPSGTWANAESFGASFAHNYLIRANFGSICNDSFETQDINICFGESFTIGSSVYSETGNYIDTIPDGFCNIIISTNLNVAPEIVPEVSLSTDQTHLSVTEVLNATYQWINCFDNTAIDGETDDILAVTVTGDYAVIVTVGTCSDTSECVFADPDFSGLKDELLDRNGFVAYPIPADEFMNIYSSEEGNYKIINSLGQTITTFDMTAGQTKKIVTENYVSGWYLILNRQNAATQKILIK